MLGNCGNPAYAEPSFKPHSGIYEEAFFTSVAKARADDGLCGPEALLFEPKPTPATIGVATIKGSWLALRIAIFGIVALLFVSWLLR